MAGEVQELEITHVTVAGRIILPDNNSCIKPVLLANRFRKSLIKAVKMYAKGIERSVIVKEVTEELNLGYADTIYKLAKLIVKEVRHNGSNQLKVGVRRLFIISRGFSSNNGNCNIRLLSTNGLQVNVSRKEWVKFKVVFDKQCVPLINELVEKALSKKLSYTANIVFRDGKPYLHVSVLMELYLKYFRKVRAKGKLIVSFNLNNDRTDMVVVDKLGIIRGVKTGWFPEIISHGFPRGKAHASRLQALVKLLDCAYHQGVKKVLFEDLERIKKPKYIRSRRANRKITRFPKRKLLEHEMVMAMKCGSKVHLVNLAYTSRIEERIGGKFGLDRHTASAYLLALKYLGVFDVLASASGSQRN